MKYDNFGKFKKDQKALMIISTNIGRKLEF